jgi:hypothetical protein
VVEHSELQSKRSNPNTRRQLRDLKEAAPYPPTRGATLLFPFFFSKQLAALV